MHSPHHTSPSILNLIATVVFVAATVVAVPPVAALAAPCPPSAHGWGWGTCVDNNNRKPGGGNTGGATMPGSGGGDGGSVSPAGNGPACDPIAPDACVDQECGAWSQIAGCQPDPGAPGGGRQITPIDLLQRELANLRLPLPKVMTAPPRGKDGRVGLPEWFWLDPTQSTPITRRAQAGPVWVELTASPQQMVIGPGAGLASVTCPGVGAAYTAAAAASSACTYTYVRSSAGLPSSTYTVTATVVWGGTWRGSGGVGGTLTPISVSDTFAVRIGEAQGLNTGGSR